MILLNVFEAIGTIAFALSGALVGMEKKLDVFGVMFLGVVTAVGGGILRDLTIGNFPPNAFKNPMFCTVSMITAVIVFFIYPKFIKKTDEENVVEENIFIKAYNDRIKNKQLQRRIKKSFNVKNIVIISDAIGLGVFTALGANAAVVHFGFYANTQFIVVCMGLFTAIGGGIIRDIIVQNTPMVLKKDIYAVASILGGFVFYYSNEILPNVVALYLCFLTTFVLRVVSIKYKINLPNFNLDVNRKI